MSSLGMSHHPSGRRSPWASLLEVRLGSPDVVMLVCALLMTGIVGALSGAVLLH